MGWDFKEGEGKYKQIKRIRTFGFHLSTKPDCSIQEAETSSDHDMVSLCSQVYAGTRCEIQAIDPILN